MSREELRETVLVDGVLIDGVDVCGTSTDTCMLSITPQQCMAFCSSRQVKWRTLGVDIRTFHDEISIIIIDCQLVRPDLRIKLSDFAKRMSCRAPVRLINPRARLMSVVLVVDDNIELYGIDVPVTRFGVRFEFV